jgi:hypothetical protein
MMCNRGRAADVPEDRPPRGTFGLVCLAVMWALTLFAAAIHLVWMGAPELLVGGTFIGPGWAAGLALPSVWLHAGVAPAVLILAGGLPVRRHRAAHLLTAATGVQRLVMARGRYGPRTCRVR